MIKKFVGYKYLYLTLAIILLSLLIFPIIRSWVYADTPSGPRLIETIKVGGGGYSPWGVAVNSVTGRLYTANDSSNNVSVIDGSNNALMTTIPVGVNPEGIGVNIATNRIYIANNSSNNVTVIDGSTNDVLASVAVGVHPMYLAVNSTSNQIYVSNSNSNSVSQISGTFNTVVDTITVGSNPQGIAINSSTHRIYVANNGSNSVSVIDSGTNAVVTTVSVGTRPTDVVVNPTTNRIYVSNYSAGTISVIDGTSNSIVSTINVAVSPHALAINSLSSANLIYAANDNSNILYIISGVSNSVVANVTIPVSSHGLDINSGLNRIYCTNYTGNNVSIVNTSNNTLVSSIAVGNQPDSAALNVATNRIYVANDSSSTLSVIDGSTNSLITSLVVGSNPQGVATYYSTSPAINRIYVANSGANSVSVINGSTNSILTTISVGNNPKSIAVNTTTYRIYIANYASNSVSVLDGSSNTIIATITNGIGTHPSDIAVNSISNKIYVANSDSNTISVIDGSTNAVIASINALGTGTSGVAVNPNTNRVYAVNSSSNNISVVDGSTNSVIATVNVGNYPVKAVVNSSTNRIYVTNLNSNSLSVIDGVSNTSIAGVGLGSWPKGLALNVATNRIYVANYHSDTLSVVQDSLGTTTSVVSSSNPADFGLPVTFTATVTGSSVTPTGSVNFFDGTNSLGTAPITSGVATFNTSALIVGSHSINAVYSGDSNYASSTGTLTQSVIHINFSDANLESAIRQAINKPSGDIYQLDLANLTSLTAESKNIINLSGLEYCTNLQTLDLDNNQISDISPLTNLIRLQYLVLNNNRVNSISALSNLFSLNHLEMDNNQINNISAISDINNLSYLNLENNQISNISALSGLNMRKLYLSNNQINSISSLANMSALDTLDIGFNRINNIASLSNLTNLIYLILQNNQISDISSLSGLTKLQDIHLDNNRISNIAALVANSGLAAADDLSLSYNLLNINTNSQNMNDIQTLLGRGVTVSFQPQNTSTSVVASPDPCVYGQTITLTASVIPAADGGFIRFTFDGVDEGAPLPINTVTGQGVLTLPSKDAGNHTIGAYYSGDANYTSSSASMSLIIIKATPAITWNNPADIVYGTALSEVQLNASSTTIGTFTYNPATGVTLNSGSGITLNVTLTPADSNNYNITTAHTTINVSKVKLTVDASDKTIVYSQSIPSFSVTYNGFVNGETGSVLSGTPNAVTTATSASPVGTYPIRLAQGTLRATNYSFTFVDGTLTINQASTSITLNTSSNPVNFGQPLTFTASINAIAPAAGVPGGMIDFKENNVTLVSSVIGNDGKAIFTTSDLELGTHTITAVYGGNDNFLGSSASKVINVATSVNLVLHGSGTLGELVESVSPTFNAAGLGTAIGAVVKNGSDTGISDLLNGTNGGCNIAMVSRPLTTAEASSLTAYAVTRNATLIIVSASVPSDITQLSIDQLKGIYEGTYTDWNQVGSATSMPIVVRARNIESGNRESLINNCNIDSVLEQSTISSTSLDRLNSNSEMQSAINDAGNGAIGYVGIGFGTDATYHSLRVLAVADQGASQSYAAIQANVYSGNYPLNNFLYLVIQTSGDSNHDKEMVFIDWMRDLDATGQDMVSAQGLYRLAADADINSDFIVNYLDLGLLGTNYGSTGDSHFVRSDINRDGNVNYLDLGILGNWYGISIIRP